MSVKKVKSPAKMVNSDLASLEQIVVHTLDGVASVVGNSLGPGGRNIIIESDLPGIPNKNTKDGVTIFRALGAFDPFEHLIIEQTRDAAIKTVNEAGDGTTTATIIAASLTKNLFNYCRENPKQSPQKIVRHLNKILKDKINPFIEKSSIKITTKNQALLEQVAKISANGDIDMASAVMEAFSITGFSSASHVTIQELSGPSGQYDVTLVEGFPINKGYEDSIGKFHQAFINDQGHQRCTLDKPLFILFDGKVGDISQIQDILTFLGNAYINGGGADYKNVVVVAHGFSDTVLTTLAFNFANPATINVVPLATPMDQIINSQLHFLMDVSAFTGAKIFDFQNPLEEANFEDLGSNMERIDIYRFRTTIVGEPDATNIETRVDDIKTLASQSESKIEELILKERMGKLTSGIAQLKIYGASNGELKEKSDRAEDAVCAVRAAINHGCLPGGCRIMINLAMELAGDDDVLNEVLVPSLLAPFNRLLENAGYSKEESEEIFDKLSGNEKIVYDVENMIYGDPKKLGLYDATLAVKQSLTNAVSIASVMGTLGGIIAEPRDHQLEVQESKAQRDFERTLDNAQNLKNEANERP